MFRTPKFRRVPLDILEERQAMLGVGMSGFVDELRSVDIVSDKEREQLRQHALEELNLLDTPESESFDRITRMASRMFGTPIAVVSLTDRSRQWFKSHVGTSGRELPRDGAPCAEVARSQAVLHIKDMQQNEHFAGYVLAREGIRFYAGAPLTTRSGHTLGAMCVLDTEPRIFTAEQIASLEDFAAMVISQIELQHEAGRIDVTSGLPNRHQLYDDIEDQKRRDPAGQRVVLVVELADLRHVNDAVSVLGASYLDGLICTSAAVIRRALGSQTALYQIGFASIALLLDEEFDPLAPIADIIMRELKAPASANGVPIIINAALGASPFGLGEASPQDALRTGVSAARQARQEDAGYATYNTDADDLHRRRFELVTRVSDSLSRAGHFQLVYQPRLDLHTGICSGAEALIRWSHPELGDISPGEFIPLIEQTALTRPVTQWVLVEALQQIRTWKKRGLSLKVSVNISARNLEEEDFVTLLERSMAAAAVSPHELELEFTESALIRFQTRVLHQLTAIRDMGVTLSIDDFGTGYSSFAYLRQLPASAVKLDQSFMRDLASNRKDQSIVRSMISMAQDIGYRVVAEGVESKEVLDLLHEFGCDEAQGYFIARPLSKEKLEQFLRTSTPRAIQNLY